MKYAAILLGAGYSRRFGSDKRIASIGGEPMLLATLGSARAALEALEPGSSPSARQLLAVIRPRDGLVRSLLAGQPVQVLHAPVWPVGIGASIRAGVTALCAARELPRALAVFPADLPLVQAGTLCELFRACAEDRICVPVFAGQRGGPVVFGRAFLGQLQGLGARHGCNRLIRANRRALCEVPVNDIGVTLDIDRVGDFHRAMWWAPAGRTPAVPDTVLHGGA